MLLTTVPDSCSSRNNLEGWDKSIPALLSLVYRSAYCSFAMVLTQMNHGFMEACAIILSGLSAQSIRWGSTTLQMLQVSHHLGHYTTLHRLVNHHRTPPQLASLHSKLPCERNVTKHRKPTHRPDGPHAFAQPPVANGLYSDGILALL